MSKEPKDLRAIGAILCLAGIFACLFGGVSPLAILGAVLLVVGIRML